MNEVMLELISSIERLGTIGLVIGIIIAVLVVIGAVYGFIKQFLDMSDVRSYITKQEEYEKVLSTSKNKEEQTVITKKDELNEELEDMKERYSKRSNIYFGFGLILLVLFIAGVGVYSARSYKLDQLNEKLSAIEINNIEDHGIIAEGELKASIENKKVQLNMIVRVTNISGEKLLHAQIVDNVSGVKINIGELCERK